MTARPSIDLPSSGRGTRAGRPDLMRELTEEFVTTLS